MSTDNRVPDLLLEQLALGELPDAQAAEVRRRLEAEPDGAARLAALEESNQSILERYPAHPQVTAIEERLEREQRAARSTPLRRPAFFAAPVALAAAALLVAVWALPVEDEYIGFKGDPRLVLHRRAGDQVEKLTSGAPAREGDLVQVGYLAGDARHGVILSLDGRGSVTLHYPARAGESTALTGAEGIKGPGGGVRTTAFAYELDDAPRFERFFFVTSDAPIDVGEVLGLARDLGTSLERSLALPAALRQAEFVLYKPGGVTPPPM